MYISEDLQKELRAKYNPDGSMLRRAQLRMVEMLSYFDDFCQKHNLTYWIDAGTLLGAVRHGGFIPWDDDTDVMMPKKDYDKLKKVMLSEPEHEEFVLQCHETDPEFYGVWLVLRDKKSEYIQDSNLHRMRKYRGVQIDIIACDNRYINTLYKFCARFRYNFINKPLLKNTNLTHAPLKVKIVYHFFQKVLVPFCHFISLPFSHDRMKYYYGAPWNSYRQVKNIYPVSRIVFENVELSAPHNPEGYLTDEYKSWQSIPPEDKIRTHDVNVVFNY